MGMKKNLMGGVAVLLIGGGAYLYMNMGNIAKNITEKMASDALGVKVSIADLDISLPEKKIAVRGIRVANPAGYTDPYALSVDLVSVKLKSLSKELIVFDDISVVGTNINLEVNQNGTNLNDIKSNLKSGAKPKAASSKSDGEKAVPVKIVIRNMLIGDASLTPRVLLIGGNGSAVHMPDIRLSGIGEKENGILVRDALGQIWDKVTKVATKSASGAGFLEGISSDALKDLGVSGSVKGLTDSLGKNLDSLGSGIKGLFGN